MTIMTIIADGHTLEQTIFTEEQLIQIREFQSNHTSSRVSLYFDQIIEEKEQKFLLSYLHIALIKNGILEDFLSLRVSRFSKIPMLLRRYWSFSYKSYWYFFQYVLAEARKWHLKGLEELIIGTLKIKAKVPAFPKVVLSSYLFQIDCDVQAHNERYYINKVLTFDSEQPERLPALPRFMVRNYCIGNRPITSLYLFLEKVVLVKLGYLIQGNKLYEHAMPFIENQEKTDEGRNFIAQLTLFYFGKGPLAQRLFSSEDDSTCFQEFIPRIVSYRLFWYDGLYSSLSIAEEVQLGYNELDEAADDQALSLTQIALQQLEADHAKSLFMEHWDENNTSFILMRTRVACCNILSQLFDSGRLETQSIAFALTRGLGYEDKEMNRTRNTKKLRNPQGAVNSRSTSTNNYVMTKTAKALDKMMARPKSSPVDLFCFQFQELSSEDQQRLRVRLANERVLE